MARKSKKSVAPQGKYAQIPVNVAKTVLAVLSAPEFRVWFALCMQCQHWSNGTGKLCRSVIREFHLGSQRVVTAASKQLIADKHIVMTRAARQRRCALYGVTFLPLNTDAMTKEGLDDAEIRTALNRFGETLSATNRGSANSATNGEAPNDGIDNRGSAKHGKQPLALPKSGGFVSKSTPLALPQGNTSKSSATPISDSRDSPVAHAVAAPFSRRVRIGKQTPAEIVRALMQDGWSDEQIEAFASRQNLTITLDEIRAERIRA